MSPRGPAMNANDDGDLVRAAHPTRCRGCGQKFYSAGVQRCIRCRTANANGNETAPAAQQQDRVPRIVIRTYPEPCPTPRQS